MSECRRYVKYYSGRRLYDCDRSRVTTLGKISTEVRAGAHFEFVELHTGRDVTALCLIEMIRANEPRFQARLSTALLREIVCAGTFSSFISSRFLEAA